MPEGTPASPSLNPDLLKLLACPISRGKAGVELQGSHLVCPCGVKYAIEDQIPNMLIEEATLPAPCASLHDLKCPHAAN